MGFTAVALEGSWGGGLLADRYVIDGKGTLDAAVQALDGWIYSCPEFMDIISWMRDYNRNAENPVHLLGIDNKSAHSALTWFRKLLPYSGGPYDASFIRDIESRLPMKAVNLSSKNPTLREEGFTFLQSLIDRLFSMLPEIEDDLTALEWAIIQHIPRAIEQVREYGDIKETQMNEIGWWVPEVWNYRDASMAENALWWLDQLGEDAKIVIYAHNGHVTRAFPEIQSIPLGQVLSEALGDAYVSIGFSTSQGACVAGDQETLATFTLQLPPPAPGSYESVLSEVAFESFALDLRALDVNTLVGEWMNTPRGFKMVGSLPDVADGQITSAYDIDVSLPAMFDVLLHIQTTSPMEIDF
jgi:erythromycin esterase